MFLPQNNSYLKHFSEYVTQSEPHLAFKGIVIYWAINRVNTNCEPWFGISMEYQVQRK